MRKTVWVYSDLRGHLQTLKSFVKEYYNTEIVPTLFEYDELSSLSTKSIGSFFMLIFRRCGYFFCKGEVFVIGMKNPILQLRKKHRSLAL